MNLDKFSSLSIVSIILCVGAVIGFFTISDENGVVDPTSQSALIMFSILVVGIIGLAIDIFREDNTRSGWAGAIGWLVFALVLPGIVIAIRRFFF